MTVVVVSTTTSTSTTSVITPIAASTASVTDTVGLWNTSHVALVDASHSRGKFAVDLIAKFYECLFVCEGNWFARHLKLECRLRRCQEISADFSQYSLEFLIVRIDLSMLFSITSSESGI